MKTYLLKFLLVICIVCYSSISFAQETGDNTTYYYNNFETATAGTTSSLGSAALGNANRVSTSTTIDASTTSPLEGSTSLNTNNTNAIGAIRWDFVGNGGGTINLNSNDWEWNFLYKNSTTTNTGDPDVMTAGSNSWRYWLVANGYTANSMQGFYISQVAGNLVLRYRYDAVAGAGRYNGILSTPLANDQQTYIIKVQRLKGGSWAIYKDVYVAGMTTAKTLATISTGTTGSGFNTYYYSYLEASTSTANRFQFDKFDMYTRILQFSATGANSASNGITQPSYYPNESVLFYGLKIIARGNFDLNTQLYVNTTASGNGLEAYFNTPGSLYKSTDNLFSTSTDVLLSNTVQISGSGAGGIQVSNLNDIIATSGNTDGTTNIPAYYFFTATTKSTLNYGSSPAGTFTFTGVSTLGENGNTTVVPYTNSSATSNTITFTNTLPPNISYNTPNYYVTGTAITTLSPSNSGGAVTTYTTTGLPAGLSLNASTGAITGTPTTVSPATDYTVTAQNSSGTSTATINITVNVPPSISYVTPQTYYVGNTITALVPTNTGSAVGSYGTPTNFTGATVPSSGPDGVAINPVNGNVYVSSKSNNSVYIFNAAGTLQSTLTGYNSPAGMTIDAAGTLYVTNRNNGTVTKTTSGGTVTTITGFDEPTDVTTDAAGNIYVTDRGGRTLSGAGSVYKLASGATTAGTAYVTGFSYPWGIQLNTAGDIFVTEPGLSNTSNAIYKIASGSTTKTTFVATSAGLASPREMTFDPAGNLFLADANSNSVKLITPAGVVSTLLTLPATPYNPSPIGVALDNSGNMFVTAYNIGYVYKSIATGYAITSGTLPAGLIFDAYNGAISGTPTTVTAATNITVTATNVYGSSSTVVNITVVNPTAPTVTNVSRCGAGSVTLTATGSLPSGGTYNWFTVSTGGTAIFTGATYSPSLVATTNYYVSYTSGTYTTARTSVTATINPIVSSPYSGAYFSYPFANNANDVSGNSNNGVLTAAPTITTDRYSTPSSAYNFNGSTQYISTTTPVTSPTTFSISLWFNTLTAGGKLIGFGGSQTGASTTYDRHIYMSSTGQVYFGAYNGLFSSINTSGSYNDGNWHHVIVTVGGSGSSLYMDGTLQASSTLVPTFNYTGYWRIGYDAISNALYPNATANAFFTGKLDDIAVYNRVLSAAEIASSNDINQIGQSTTVCVGTPLTLYTPAIAGATYTWTDPSGATATGQAATFPTAVAGAYSLTVTGGPGGCSSTATYTPTLYALPTAAFTATTAVDINTNSTVTLTSTYDATLTYAWNFNGGTPSTGTGAGPFTVKWATSGVKTITLTLTNSNGCTATVTQNVVVNGTTYGNYAFRKVVTLNTAAVGITSTLANFPALLSIQDNDLIISGTCTDKLYIPGGPNYDFAFVDASSATELNYQVESYNQTTGTLLVWVKIPSVSSASNNTLSFYYGSTAPPVTHNTTFFQNTWTTDYQAVYHFNETGYTGTTSDGTGNNRTATLVGFQSSDYTTSGKIGSAYTFGGTAGSPTVNDMEAAQAPVTTAFTISAWVNMTTGGLDQKIISNQGPSGTSSGGYKLGIFTNNVPETEDYGNLNRQPPYYNITTPTPAAPTLSTGTWYYIQGVYNGSNISTYVNGVQYAVLPSTGNPFLTTTLYIGIGEGKQYPFSGLIDEPRVSNVAKTTDWLKMEYVDQNNPVAFTSISATRTTNVANAAPVPGFLTYTWKGVNTNINNANNWDNTTAGTTNQLPAFDGTATLVIPTGLSNYPTLTANASLYGLTIASGAAFNLGGFTLNVGCNIYNSSNGTINWNSNNASTINWNGSSAAQSYNGSNTAGTAQLGTMIVNNTAAGTVTINSGVLDIYSLLTMTNGNLTVGSTGTMTLKSVALQSAAVDQITNTACKINGLVNVERFLTGGGSLSNRGYRLLSSPVNQTGGTAIPTTNTFGINYLNSHVYRNVTYPGAFTAGPGTAPANGFSFSNTNPTIYIYRENLVNNNSLFTSGKNVAVTAINTTNTTLATGTTSTIDLTNTQTGPSYGQSLPVGNGFLMYFVGPSTRSDGSTTLAPADATLTAGGYLNQQNITVNLWYSPAGGTGTLGNAAPSSPGFNMVGNPYASTINLLSVLNDNNGTNGIDNIYLLSAKNSPNQTYTAYTANGTSAPLATGGQGYAVSGEGFMVHVKSSAGINGALTFKETEKAPAIQLTGAALIMSAPQKPVLAINGINAGTSFNQLLPIAGKTSAQSVQAGLTGFFMKMEKDSTTYDYCGIYFNDQWHAKFEDGDARDLDGAGPKVYMSSYSSDGVRAAVKHFPDYRKGARIRLYADGKSDGLYNLKIEGIQNIDTNNYKITLLDHFKKDSTDLGRYKTYAFNVLRSDTNTFGGNRFELSIQQLPTSKYQLATFTAQKANDGVLVTWRTYNEGNDYFFTLEKQQANGTDFLPVYQLQSNGGTIYKYTDKTPNTGNNVYRLKQVDLFGNIIYSGPVNVYYDNTGNAGMFTVYPNPTAETLNVNITYGKTSSAATGSYKLNIYDATGSLVMQKTSGNSNWSENVSQFKPGVYIVELKGDSGNSLGKAKFVKK